jgi:hypothetical protein
VQIPRARQRSPLRFGLVLSGGLLAVLSTACASAPTQTTAMTEEGVVASSQALRIRLRSEAVPFTGRVEQSFDRIAAGSADEAVKQRALVWKIDAVPALYRTLFHQYPLLALLDSWALLLQFQLYFESPEGKAAFGPGASDILGVLHELETQVQGIAHWAAPKRDLVKVRASLLRWAVQHPIEETPATRVSITEHLVSNAPQDELSAFALVGQVTEDIDGIVSRMDFMPVLVPRQATWQAELTYRRLLEPRMKQAFADGDQVTRKLDQIAAWLGPPGIDDFADRQRVAILRALDAERLEIQQLLQDERGRATDFVSKERSVVLEQLKQERIAVTEELRRAVDHATADASQHEKELVDYTLLRLALAEVSVILVLLVGLWLLRRTDRRPTPPVRD